MSGDGPTVLGLPIGWGGILNAIELVVGGGALASWLRTRPKMREVERDGDEKLRSEMWKDIEALKASKDSMSVRLTTAETRIAGQTVQIGQLRFISALVIDELDRRDPGNTIARQARVLLREVQPDAMPGAIEIATMAESLKAMDPPPQHGGKA